ncbi:hypothetical protein [Novosphingobium colocasiae]|uniref:hypothetical protein n=1 Tax=Novosphingobium colocasiae TaxID=1256513 RepID=UPI0035B0811A
MSITDSIAKSVAEFSAALDAARAELADVAGQISKLEQERSKIEAAQPHTEDIVAVFQNGLDEVKSGFEQQFRSVLNASFVKGANGNNFGDAARAARPGSRRNVLAVAPAKDQRFDRDIIAKDGFPQLNVTALVYFLRGKIADELPDIIDRLCPDARHGMKAADREKAIAEIDGKLSELREKHNALQLDLNAARQAANR